MQPGDQMRRRIALLWALLLWTAPCAADELSAEQLVDRIAEALGGRDVLAAVPGYELTSSAEGLGLSGTATIWARFPDQQRNELSLPPLALLSVHDGPEAWFRDHNGQVVAFSDDQLADAVTGLYIDAFRPWIEPFDPETIRLGDPVQAEGLTCQTLVVEPPGGHPWILAIHPENSLPVLQVHPDESGIGAEVLMLRDYRAVDGVQVPHEVVAYNDSLPDNATVYRVQSVVFRAPDGPALFQRPSEISDVTFQPGVTSVELPLRYETGHALIDVHVIGRSAAVDGAFLLDTGATLSMVDAALLPQLNLEPAGDLEGLAVGGTLDVELVEIPFFRVPGVLLEDQVVGVAAFAEDVSAQLGVEVAGILGYDFFSRFAVTLDLPGRTCTLHHANAWRAPDHGAVLPIEFVDHQPTVHGVLDGAFAGRWRLDTGADALAVHGPAAEAWDLLDLHGPGHPLTTAGMGGTSPAVLVQAHSFALGPYEIGGPRLLLPQGDTGVLHAESIAGNLGTSILERFVLTIDLGREQLHLHPGRGFKHGDRVRTVDFHVGRVGARLEVIRVLPGGEGHSAGLRVGQRVLRIAGRPAARWSDTELNALWAGQGAREITLVVQGDDGRERVHVQVPAGPAEPAP